MVKPITASCISTPVPPDDMNSLNDESHEQVKNQPFTLTPNRLNAENVRKGKPFHTQPSTSKDISGRLVAESMFPGPPGNKLEQECQRISLYQREASSSRISSVSFSSLAGLGCLQSPQPKSLDNGSITGENHNNGSLDSFDQNFMMTLNTLQANHIDDLENVLFPHLGAIDSGGRADSALNSQLLDLNSIDIREESAQEGLSPNNQEDCSNDTILKINTNSKSNFEGGSEKTDDESDDADDLLDSNTENIPHGRNIPTVLINHQSEGKLPVERVHGIQLIERKSKEFETMTQNTSTVIKENNLSQDSAQPTLWKTVIESQPEKQPIMNQCVHKNQYLPILV